MLLTTWEEAGREAAYALETAVEETASFEDTVELAVEETVEAAASLEATVGPEEETSGGTERDAVQPLNRNVAERIRDKIRGYFLVFIRNSAFRYGLRAERLRREESMGRERSVNSQLFIPIPSGAAAARGING